MYSFFVKKDYLMYKGKLCLYFKCDYEIDINATNFAKLISAVEDAVSEFGVQCALNSCTTVFDLLFYKAVEACKTRGINIDNCYVKYDGRAGRRFDEYIRLHHSNKFSGVEDYIHTIGDICLDFTKKGIRIYKTERQMRRRND